MRTFQALIRSVGRHAAMGPAVIAMLGITAAAASAQAKSQPRAAKKSSIDIVLAQPAQPKAGDNQFEVTVKGADGKRVNTCAANVWMVWKRGARSLCSEAGNVMMAGKRNATITVKQNGKHLGQNKIVLTAA